MLIFANYLNLFFRQKMRVWYLRKLQKKEGEKFLCVLTGVAKFWVQLDPPFALRR